MMETTVGHIGWLGYTVFTTVIGSLLFVILAAILAKPWKPKVFAIFLAPILLMASGFVALAWVGGAVFGLFIP